jgi:serine/threonine protein kinase
MGIVYKAHHRALDITVALKLLHPLLPHSGDIDRFLREARVAARLRHPNIVGVLNVGSEGDHHFLVMEYIDGCNLLTLIQREQKLDISWGVNIACQTLDALDCVYKNAIVHRDIKPENILVDSQGCVKLTDCGLARGVTDTSITQPSILIGSPNYIAPEQAENPRNVDNRADIYSLGCTLFHVFSGKPPFEGDTPIQIVLDHLRKDAPTLHDIDSSIPIPISNVIRKMMDKHPQNRYQTPLEAKQELLSALNQQVQPENITTSQSARLTDDDDDIFVKPKSNVLPIVIVILVAIGFLTSLFVFLTSNGNKKKPSLSSVSTEKNFKSEQHNSSSDVQTLLEEIQKGDIDRVKALLTSGTDPNAGDIPPLVIAVQSNSEIIVQLLLEKGALPDQMDPSGRTALHYAIYNNNSQIMKQLLIFKADPNKPDPSSRKPLQLTIDPALVDMLTKYGAR